MDPPQGAGRTIGLPFSPLELIGKDLPGFSNSSRVRLFQTVVRNTQLDSEPRVTRAYSIIAVLVPSLFQMGLLWLEEFQHFPYTNHELRGSVHWHICLSESRICRRFEAHLDVVAIAISPRRIPDGPILSVAIAAEV